MKVVQQDIDESAEFKANAIKAIPLHNMDHKNATLDERKKFHEFCRSSFCKFLQLPEEERKNFTRKKDGDFHVFDPTEQAKIIAEFEKLGSLEKLKKLGLGFNTNTNESVHSKYFQKIMKIRHYSYERLCMVAEHIILTHNFGHLRGSLLNNLGMNVRERRHLERLDKRTQQKAKKKKKYEWVDPKGKDTESHYQPGGSFEDKPDDPSDDEEQDPIEMSDHTDDSSDDESSDGIPFDDGSSEDELSDDDASSEDELSNGVSEDEAQDPLELIYYSDASSEDELSDDEEH